MTYCVSMLLDAGMVFLSDSRTNAGVDHINTFRKMSIFQRPGERVMVLMSSGNLAITQQLVSMLRESMAAQDGRENLWTAPNMFEAARHIGETLREVHNRDADALQKFGIDFTAALILGGQIGREQPRFDIFGVGLQRVHQFDARGLIIMRGMIGDRLGHRIVRRVAASGNQCQRASGGQHERAAIHVLSPVREKQFLFVSTFYMEG